MIARKRRRAGNKSQWTLGFEAGLEAAVKECKALGRSKEISPERGLGYDIAAKCISEIVAEER